MPESEVIMSEWTICNFCIYHHKGYCHNTSRRMDPSPRKLEGPVQGCGYVKQKTITMSEAVDLVIEYMRLHDKGQAC